MNPLALLRSPAKSADEITEPDRVTLLTQLLCRFEKHLPHSLDVTRRGIAGQTIGDRDALHVDRLRRIAEGRDESSGLLRARVWQVGLTVVASASGEAEN